MERSAYEINKNSIKRYASKCVRLQILLNPENPEDKALIDFLDASNGPRFRSKTAKIMLKKYMQMTAALKGFQ